ncbi:7-carboxy-7-deazaguanine synthase, partial [ANME-1 cluster archaeon GoMg2]|nr:7-carboxy-7-deazaguanine synthase [ANME-1 cluster archaeon GoMg2]
MVAASNAAMDVVAIVELDKLKQNTCVGVPRTFYFFIILSLTYFLIFVIALSVSKQFKRVYLTYEFINREILFRNHFLRLHSEVEKQPTISRHLAKYRFLFCLKFHGKLHIPLSIYFLCDLKMNVHEAWTRGFKNCNLCEWNCRVNRLEGELGVCGAGMPEIAYCNLAQVLQSYSVTMLGCNFKCIYCNAYRLSQYPGSGWFYRGYVEPSELASEAIYRINSREGRAMGVDKISFTGGEPTIHLPYIKKVVEEARKKMPRLGVGFAT